MNGCSLGMSSTAESFVRDRGATVFAGRRRMGKDALMDVVEAALRSMHECNIIRIDTAYCGSRSLSTPQALEDHIRSRIFAGVPNYVLIVDADAVPGWESAASGLSESAGFFYAMELCHQLPSCARFDPSSH